MWRVQAVLACLALLFVASIARDRRPDNGSCFPRPRTRGQCISEGECGSGFHVDLSWGGCPQRTVCCVQGNSQKRVAMQQAPPPAKGSFKFKFYGNWCGPGHSGGSTGNEGPRDKVDEICKVHDACYNSKGYGQCSCDDALVDGMNGAVGKTKSIKAKVSGFAIKKFFQIMPCNKPGENYTSKQLAMRKIKEIVKLPFKKISKSAPVKMIKSAWNKSKNYGKRIYSKLRDKLKEKFGKVKKFAGKAKKFAGKATNFLKKKFSGLKGGTKKVLSKGKSVAKSAYNKAKSGVKKVSSGVKKVASGVKKVASGAKNVVSKGWSKIKSIF